MTSQCVGSNYANGFHGSSPGLPGGSCQGFPQRTPRGCWDGVGATLFSGVAGVFPGSRLAAGSLERSGCELCRGRVKQEGGWARWYLWLHRGAPSLVA